jgi:hypothetical protein
LPVLVEAFLAGRVSYSQVRTLTKVATPEDQQRWVELARTATAAQLERLVRGVRRATKPERDTADPEMAAWMVRARKSFDGDGNAVYRLVVPAEQAAVVDAAVEVVMRQLDSERAAGVVSAGTSSPQAAAPDARDVAGGVSAETSCPPPTAYRCSTTLPCPGVHRPSLTPNSASQRRRCRPTPSPPGWTSATPSWCLRGSGLKLAHHRKQFRPEPVMCPLRTTPETSRSDRSWHRS